MVQVAQAESGAELAIMLWRATSPRHCYKENDCTTERKDSMRAIISGIAVELESVSLSGIKIASAKAWATTHGLSFYDVAFGVETLNASYDDARRFTSQVYAHFEGILK